MLNQAIFIIDLNSRYALDSIFHMNKKRFPSSSSLEGGVAQMFQNSADPAS